MNKRSSNLIRGFSYTITSNFVSIIVSTLVILIVPKLIGVEEYGYWQLYLFYSSYVGFLHFGWNDGIYLRYGGKEYKDLDKKLFFSQFYMLFIQQAIIVMALMIVFHLTVIDSDRKFVFEMIALCMIIVNLRFMILYILQGTNRIKEYAQITMLDRIIYSCLIIAILAFGVRDYRLMIISDLIGKLLSLTYAMYCCKDIIFRRFSTFYFNISEMIENITIGIKLMFATIASMLIIGVVRFGIERMWDVTTFGKVSLTLSISNLLMTFINAVGIVMFPILRRTDESKLPEIYSIMRNFLMFLLLALLIVYYPFKLALSNWLPQYADSLVYMAIVFPMCVYEGKTSLLVSTYLKTIRKENLMLKLNLVSLFLSVIVTILTTVILRDLDLAILSIVIVLAFKCILSEIFLSRILGIQITKDVVLELILTCIFISTGWYLNSWISFFIYITAYLLYLLIKRKEIISTITSLKALIKTP